MAGVRKQTRELVIVSEQDINRPPLLPADKVTQGDIPLG
jgi:hypothetical protein